MSIFGILSPGLELSVEPALSSSAAGQALLTMAGNEPVMLTAPEVVILRLDDGDHRLAYTSAVSGSGDVIRAFIDAHTGIELMRYTVIQTQQAAVGTGVGVLGDRKKLSVESTAGTYIAFDRHRPPIIETLDMRGSVAHTKNWLIGQVPHTVSDIASDSDNVWSDVAVVDAHVHVGWTYDYYFKRFGRSGFDGRNGPIDIVVNAVSQQGARALPDADYFTFAVNAFWCPPCGPDGRGAIFFGNGIAAGADAGNGRNYTYFSGALDIAAHELTHAVTTATSDLIYRNESGALNEAFSDIMGKSVEFFYHPTGSGVGQADYVLGKDISRGVRAGTLNGDRSMANPALYGDPDHASSRFSGAGDNGGVHINSAIPNQVFYLAIEGGTNRTSGSTVPGVGAANREQIEKVFYRAFTLLMPASSTFGTARTATIQAARDLYGAGGAVERAVTQGWNAVGVPNPDSVATVTGVSSSRFTWGTFTMPSTGRYQATLTWGDPRIDLDLYLSPVSCTTYSCLLTFSEAGDGSSETIGWPVRSGEQYRLWIDNWSNRSTPFTVQHFVSPLNSTSFTGSDLDSSPPSIPSVGELIRSAGGDVDKVKPTATPLVVR